MKKVIFSTPRAGSTCAYNYLLRNKEYIDIDTIAYSTKHKTHPDEYVAPGEWLNKDIYTQEEIHDNILFLQEEKTYGREYSVKILVPHINPYYWDWFYNFYTADEIYIIRRRDIWKQYKSVIYQMSVDWGNSNCRNKNIKHYKPLIWPASEYIPATDWFFNWTKIIYEFNYGEVLYYEDHNWGNETIIVSEHIDYEKHFINFEEIKNHFDAEYSMYKQTV